MPSPSGFCGIGCESSKNDASEDCGRMHCLACLARAAPVVPCTKCVRPAWYSNARTVQCRKCWGGGMGQQCSLAFRSSAPHSCLRSSFPTSDGQRGSLQDMRSFRSVRAGSCSRSNVWARCSPPARRSYSSVPKAPCFPGSSCSSLQRF